MSKISEINFKIQLDENKIPEKIEWQASDSGEAYTETKSIMLSMWDQEEKTAMRIDLWTQDMRVDEMDAHFFQTLITLAESYQRATNSSIVVDEMQNFCESLADKISAAEKAKKQN